MSDAVVRKKAARAKPVEKESVRAPGTPMARKAAKPKAAGPRVVPPAEPRICSTWDEFYQFVKKGHFPRILWGRRAIYDSKEVRKRFMPPPPPELPKVADSWSDYHRPAEMGAFPYIVRKGMVMMDSSEIHKYILPPNEIW